MLGACIPYRHRVHERVTSLHRGQCLPRTRDLAHGSESHCFHGHVLDRILCLLQITLLRAPAMDTIITSPSTTVVCQILVGSAVITQQIAGSNDASSDRLSLHCPVSFPAALAVPMT